MTACTSVFHHWNTEFDKQYNILKDHAKNSPDNDKGVRRVQPEHKILVDRLHELGVLLLAAHFEIWPYSYCGRQKPKRDKFTSLFPLSSNQRNSVNIMNSCAPLSCGSSSPLRKAAM